MLILHFMRIINVINFIPEWYLSYNTIQEYIFSYGSETWYCLCIYIFSGVYDTT